jgi:hypothetical protein
MIVTIDLPAARPSTGGGHMTRIVTSTYRYKRPPRKGRKLAEITGPRIVTPADPKKGRRPSLPSGKAAAEVALHVARPEEEAGDTQPSTKPPPPANDDGPRKPAIITVPDHRTAQRQREQQQMAKLMAADQPKRSAIVTMRSAGEAMGSYAQDRCP